MRLSSQTISVAPMEGLTTFPMRLWLHLASQPEAMTTPFLRVTRAHPVHEIPSDFVPELYQLKDVLPYRITPQFISADPEQFLRAVDMMPPFLAPVIELNCGCPSPNSLGRLAGSGMLHDAEAFGLIIERLTKAMGPSRLAVKMRMGIDAPEEFPALLKALLDHPLARLTIHGRTRADGYRGHARWEGIQMGAKAARVPVIASGDVLGHKSLSRLHAVAPDLKGAMIGRGVLRNPWVFEEIRSGQATVIDPITLANALLAYALLQDLWQTQPQKLLARVSSGRIGALCGTDAAAWEKLAVELTALVFGVPFIVHQGFKMPASGLSPVAFARLKILWSYLRSGLPEAFSLAALVRAKTPQDFFEAFLKAAEAYVGRASLLVITHQPEWDSLFAGARG